MQSIDLKEFYESSCGVVTQRIVRQHVREFWPDVSGGRVVGIGYALPYLKHFMGEASHTVGLIHETQGGLAWPPGGKNLVALYGDAGLPLETNSVSRILVVHAADTVAGLSEILGECWRVLEGQGRLILIVPNRAGLWARADSTPFGHGAPWSMRQLKTLLREHKFAPERSEKALFVPPAASRLLLATAPIWEKLGRRFFNAFGGVNIVEVSKQLYATVPPGARAPATQSGIRPGIQWVGITKKDRF